MNTQTFYDRLRCCYLDTGNSNDAKAFFMRQILEDYFNFLNNVSDEGEKLNFASAQALWMERTGNYRLSREITYIRQELNKVVHRAKTDISNNTLRAYYEFTVRIINLISNDMPDDATMAAYGYVKDTYLNDLNEHQRDAVIDSSKIVYVNAGPGTGKTHLLVYKIIDLLVKERDNAKIVAMSYTRSSAASLTRKIEEKTLEMNVIKFNFPYSGTIHSYCLNSLKAYAIYQKKRFDYVIADDVEIDDITDDIYFSTECKFEKEVIREYLLHPEMSENKELRKTVDEKKNIYKRISVGEILELYLKTLKEDDSFVKWTAGNVNYLLVDEAQDLTDVNYQILACMIEKIPQLKLFLVGDPRQNIFSFLGGSYKHMVKFLEKYDNVARKNLRVSYRCPQLSLDYTNSLKFEDCDNIPLESYNSFEGDILIKEYEDEYEEAQAVIDYIKEIKDKGQIAILTPRLRQVSRIVDVLNEEKIHFTVLGGRTALKSHIQAFSYMNRLIETQGKSLGPANGLCEKIEHPRCRSMQEFMSTDIGISLNKLLISYMNGNISYLDLSRSFVRLCKKYLPNNVGEQFDKDFKLLYDCIIKKSDSPAAFSKLFKYYRNLFSSLEVEFKSNSTEGQPIVISTMHSAKGLEWEHVIIPGMCDRYFPNPKINDEVDGEIKREHMNNSLKLMFVAVTRAKETLFITYPSRIKDANCDARPSRFLRNLIL